MLNVCKMKYSRNIHEIFTKYSRNIHEIFTKYSRNIHEIFTKYSHGFIYDEIPYVTIKIYCNNNLA